MVVRRNFEELYRREEDPWSIGNAESLRYDVYLDWIRRHAPEGGFGKALDLGCGKGAFTARIASLALETTGLELSEIAVSKARAAHPGIRFLKGDIRKLSEAGLEERCFDLIVASDVIAYLTPREAEKFLLAAGRLLSPGGLFFLAAWSPGGRYFTPDSLERLFGRRYSILLSRNLPSRHAAFLGRARRRDVVLTVDYETWQPLPEGKRLDWRETVLEPAESLMAAAQRHRAPLTFFVEMGEILYLRQHDPATAAALEEQIRQARLRGHDVQLHLHPEWLPESAPVLDESGTAPWWDPNRSRIHQLDESAVQLLDRLKRELEAIVRPVDPAYRVRVFRAGKYRIQPHAEIFQALQSVGISADSSVWHGGWSFEHRFDFRNACSTMTPYFPSDSDINLPAPPAEEGVMEFPILSVDGRKFSLDGAGATDLLDSFRQCGRSDLLSRFKERHPNAWRKMAGLLRRMPVLRGWTRLEREPVASWNLAGDDTLVAIGHTKGNLRYREIEAFLEILSRQEEVRFLSFAQVVQERNEERERRLTGERDVLDRQVEREWEAILGEARNEAQSAHLQAKVPKDRGRVLDLGCGAGYWTKVLEKQHGFCLGVDYGKEFLEKAREVHDVKVARCDFNRLPFPDGSFDAVYADNVLEHAADPSRVLNEIRRILARRGLLAAALPPDARNRRYPVSDHLWKTDRHDLERRLKAAGFTRIRVEEVDTVEQFSMPAYPASENAMLYVTAWSNGGEEYTDRQRAEDLMDFVYRKLDPSKSQKSLDPDAILREGFAWCLGYCAVLGSLAHREGIPSRYVTLEARDHPRGRGEAKIDTHELVELYIAGRWLAFDPMARRILEGSVEEILADPSLADRAMTSRLADERFRGRGYHLYCSSFFYQRVTRFCRRDSLTSGESWTWVRVSRPGTGGKPRPTRLVLLTERPAEDRLRLTEKDPTAASRTWTREDLAEPASHWERLRKMRRIPEKRLEILSEDLAWHEQVIRIHLLGAAASPAIKVFKDRKGNEEALGLRPLLTRQLPAWLAASARATWAIPRIHGRAALMERARRRSPRHLPARRSASVLYLRSDLWRGLRAGGSVGHVCGMAQAFQREGQSVSFLAADLPAGIDREAMAVHLVPPPALLRVSRSAARFEHSFQLVRSGVQIFRGDPPGLLYHRFDEGSLAGVLLSRALGIPLVLEYNGSGIWIADHWDRPLPYRRTFEAIERANLRHAHLIVAVSEVLRDQLLSRGVEPHRILVCPNGVDPGIYHPERDPVPLRRKLGLEGKTVVGFIGTFGPWHGAPILARAAGEVMNRHPEVAFLFVGDGPERGRTEEILRQMGVAERCRFTGLIPQEEAPDYLAACDVFASPHVPNPDGTRFFGSPTKLFEYMAMGRGIVASRLEQIGEILQDGETALLVPPGDPAALSAALSRLLGDAALSARLGQAARRQVVAHHTWEQNARAVLELVRFL